MNSARLEDWDIWIKFKVLDPSAVPCHSNVTGPALAFTQSFHPLPPDAESPLVDNCCYTFPRTVSRVVLGKWWLAP